MPKPNNIFLTDERRQVLNGTTDLEGQALNNQKSRIHIRARMALDELIEVAESPEIKNSTVFDPETLSRLISAQLAGLIDDGDHLRDVHYEVSHALYEREQDSE